MSPDPDPNDIPADENVSGGPIADKGDMTAPMHGDGRPADGGDGTPGVSPEAIDRLAGDGTPNELDFEGGTMDTEEITGGESVIEAEYADRGPADHLADGVDAGAAADVADLSAGDRLTGTGLEGDDEDRPDTADRTD